MDTQLLTLRELHQKYRRYGMTIPWLKTEALAGRIPYLRLGRKLVFVSVAVEAALVQRASQEVVSHD